MFFTKPKIDLKMIAGMSFTSKTRIKQYALMLSKGDVKYAAEIYDFLIKDLDELPIEDPVPPTTIDKIKDTLGGGVSWFRENEDTITKAFDKIMGLVQSRRGMPVANASSSQPLTPIN